MGKPTHASMHVGGPPVVQYLPDDISSEAYELVTSRIQVGIKKYGAELGIGKDDEDAKRLDTHGMEEISDACMYYTGRNVRRPDLVPGDFIHVLWRALEFAIALARGATKQTRDRAYNNMVDAMHSCKKV
jgi:hypothetical protein